MIQTATQIVKKIFKKFHNDLTKKTHQTYYFCDDSMNNEKMAEKQTFQFVEKGKSLVMAQNMQCSKVRKILISPTSK